MVFSIEKYIIQISFFYNLKKKKKGKKVELFTKTHQKRKNVNKCFKDIGLETIFKNILSKKW